MPTSHPNEQLLEYVLATLSHDEMAHIDAHIRVCDVCRSHVDAMRVELFDTPAQQPRAYVKTQLFNIVTFDRDFGAVLRAARYTETLRWVWAAALFVVGSAFASIVLWNGYFNRAQLNIQTMPTRESIATDTSRIADFMAQNDIATLRFVATSMAATATLQGYVHPLQPGVLLVGRDFPRPNDDYVYMAWITRARTTIRAGVFALDATGAAWLYLPDVQLCDTCQVTVTLEEQRNTMTPSPAVLFQMVYSK